jgi:hypothetical protein
MKKSIKAIYAFFAGIVSAIVVALLIFGKKKQTVATPEPVVKNNADINKIEGKIEVIEEQREEIKNDIKTQEQVVAELETKKETVKPVEKTNVTEAKDNIIKKSKRGRKKKQ